MNDARDRGELLNAAMAEVVDQARWAARIKSVRELASQAGMTHTALNARMSGKVTFNARDLGALAYVLGVSPAELMERAQAIVGSRSQWADSVADSRDAYTLIADEDGHDIEDEQDDDAP